MLARQMDMAHTLKKGSDVKKSIRRLVVPMACAALMHHFAHMTLLKFAAGSTTKAAEMSSKFTEEILGPLHGLVHNVLPDDSACHFHSCLGVLRREVHQATTSADFGFGVIR